MFAYKLIAAGTVGEKSVDLQSRPARLAAAMLSEKRIAYRGIAAVDVASIFRAA